MNSKRWGRNKFSIFYKVCYIALYGPLLNYNYNVWIIGLTILDWQFLFRVVPASFFFFRDNLEDSRLRTIGEERRKKITYARCVSVWTTRALRVCGRKYFPWSIKIQFDRVWRKSLWSPRRYQMWFYRISNLYVCAVFISKLINIWRYFSIAYIVMWKKFNNFLWWKIQAFLNAASTEKRVPYRV